MILKEPDNNKLVQEIQEKKREKELLNKKIKCLNADWNPENEKLISKIVNYEKTIFKALKDRKIIMNNALSLIKEAINPSNMNDFLVCFNLNY